MAEAGCFSFACGSTLPTCAALAALADDGESAVGPAGADADVRGRAREIRARCRTCVPLRRILHVVMPAGRSALRMAALARSLPARNHAARRPLLNFADVHHLFADRQQAGTICPAHRPGPGTGARRAGPDCQCRQSGRADLPFVAVAQLGRLLLLRRPRAGGGAVPGPAGMRAHSAGQGRVRCGCQYPAEPAHCRCGRVPWAYCLRFGIALGAGDSTGQGRCADRRAGPG
ncbi:hypothetical protein HZS92_03859 [Xanthomonas citri pv. citri]|nr:hypothetical protein HZS92_03859 [Xanthomonas citri pv. citri]